jgi:hypothetical protein
LAKIVANRRRTNDLFHRSSRWFALREAPDALQTTNTRTQLEIPMNKFAIAFLAAASIAAFGCKKKGGGDMVAAYEKYVNDVCACKDTACMTKATDDYNKANQEAMKNPDPEAMKKMGEDPKYVELGKKFAECSAKVTAAAAGAAAGGAAPAAGGAAPAGEGSAAAPAAGGAAPAGEGSAPAPAGGAEGSGSAAK